MLPKGASSNNTGRSPRVFQLDGEGMHMPVFTFEKISSPVRPAIAPIVKKQRGLLVQILNRFVGARVRRTSPGEKGGIARRQQRSQE
jgi:hypothetical protein